MLSLYTVFHLNLAYSSIEEESHAEVVANCYWPLLRMAREIGVVIGVEASGRTLEIVAAVDPDWVHELAKLWREGGCEFVGCGYAQIIGPLVPASVNRANLAFGHEVYERLLGRRPAVALVNEQAYSAGLVPLYLEAGYKAIIMEWDNPYRHHPEWNKDWRYFPQVALGPAGERIPVIWNKSVAFQKFQRYAHGEMELDEYLGYLRSHQAQESRSFSLYGNDVEIFNFRPGRFHTEAAMGPESEWDRITHLFKALKQDSGMQLIRPGQVLEQSTGDRAGHELHLESAPDPVPVKKQGKYNLTRWAVTGRDDLGANTLCWRCYSGLQRAKRPLTHPDWRELCRWWSSDYRTHITQRRWDVYRAELHKFATHCGASTSVSIKSVPAARKDTWPEAIKVQNHGRYLTVITPQVNATFNLRKGLASESLIFPEICDRPLCGTLPHGFYDDISLAADFFSGHVIIEMPGQHKITDLQPVEPDVRWDADLNQLVLRVQMDTQAGRLTKEVCVALDAPSVTWRYELDRSDTLMGSLRLGMVTLHPEAFDVSSLYYATHLGGSQLERFYFGDAVIDHGQPASFLVSARQAVGLTEGIIELGDAQRALRVSVDREASALVGLLTYRRSGRSCFCRCAFSAREMDDTCVIGWPDLGLPLVASVRVEAIRPSNI